MSQHASLKAGGVGGRHRNVLKRFERIKILLREGKWDESKSAYNLPKVKSLKIKVKKAKAEEKPKVEGAGKAAAPGAAPQAPAKAAAAPKQAQAAPKAAASKAPAPKAGK